MCQIKKQNGFSLLDAILWLTIIAIGAISIFSNYKSASDASKAKTEIDASLVTLSNFKNLLSSGGISVAANTEITSNIAGMGLVPKVFTSTSTTMTNGQGGNIKAFSSLDGLGYIMEFGGLPSQMCAGLATSINEATKVGFTSTNKDSSSSSSSAVIFTKPVPIDKLNSGCNSATNTVQFYLPK